MKMSENQNVSTVEFVKVKRNRKSGGKVTCKICGKLGHMAKTCSENPDRTVKIEKVAKVKKNSLYKEYLTLDEIKVVESFRAMQQEISVEKNDFNLAKKVASHLNQLDELEQSTKDSQLVQSDNAAVLAEILAETGKLF